MAKGHLVMKKFKRDLASRIMENKHRFIPVAYEKNNVPIYQM